MRQVFPTLRAVALVLALTGGWSGSSLAATEPATDEEAIAAVQRAYERAVRPGEQADLHRELFASVFQRVKRSYARSVEIPALAAAATQVLQPLAAGEGEPADVFKKAIRESLRTLDPHSRYIDARAVPNERGDSTGSFGGLGMEVQASEGAVKVVAPMPGSPAERAGVVAGDLIVRIDDQPLAGIPLPEAIARMRGQPGSAVVLTIQRPGAASEITVPVTREIIRRQLVRWTMEGDALVLRLASFSGAAGTALDQAVAEATAYHSPRSVVLDLRGNPGGLLREAVKVADAFLTQGEIVSLRSSTTPKGRAWQADAGELLAGLPMVVLVDSRSASASELVADALQQHGRAIVMGQRSTGKGTVQTTFMLGDLKGALKLTTAIYQGPSGETVDSRGVEPDVEILDGKPASVPGAKAHIVASRCTAGGLKEKDAAMACALGLLRAGNVSAFVAGMPVAQ
ncbi:MAG: S41 family peptidase [Pseudomonadota bacterium]